MTIVTKKDRIGATRGKLALVGVLAVVLVVVIVVQLRGSGGIQSSPAATSVSTHEEQTVVAALSATKSSSKQNPAREWPELTMDAIARFDPLMAPAWYVAATRPVQPDEQDDSVAEETAENQGLKNLLQTGASIVLISDEQRVATIGEQQVRIGDQIEGYEVSDITEQGIVLTKSASH